MKNWKTTLSGLFATAGALMIKSTNPTTQAVGQILLGAGILLLGASAKDHNVTGR